MQWPLDIFGQAIHEHTAAVKSLLTVMALLQQKP